MDREDFMDFTKILSIIVGVVLLAVVAIMCGSVGYSLAVNKPACEAYGVMSKQATYYSLGTSCIVERNGEWVNYEVAVGKKQEITVKSK